MRMSVFAALILHPVLACAASGPDLQALIRRAALQNAAIELRNSVASGQVQDCVWRIGEKGPYTECSGLRIWTSDLKWKGYEVLVNAIEGASVYEVRDKRGTPIADLKSFFKSFNIERVSSGYADELKRGETVIRDCVWRVGGPDQWLSRECAGLSTTVAQLRAMGYVVSLNAVAEGAPMYEVARAGASSSVSAVVFGAAAQRAAAVMSQRP